MTSQGRFLKKAINENEKILYSENLRVELQSRSGSTGTADLFKTKHDLWKIKVIPSKNKYGITIIEKEFLTYDEAKAKFDEVLAFAKHYRLKIRQN